MSPGGAVAPMPLMPKPASRYQVLHRLLPERTAANTHGAMSRFCNPELSLRVLYVRPRDSQPAPLRNPFSYVQDGGFATKPKVMKQGEYGVRTAQRSLIRPATAPPVNPKQSNAYPDYMPMPTAYPPDRLYDHDICFPRGDIGAQMFPPEVSKRDGNLWAAQARKQSVVCDCSSSSLCENSAGDVQVLNRCAPRVQNKA